MSRPNSQLTPAQQDLLLAALVSNSKPNQRLSAGGRASSRDSMSDKAGNSGRFDPNAQTTPPSGHFDFGPDDSPYLEFDVDGEGDDSYDFDVNGQMIGDLPEPAGDLHDKRKSIDGKNDDDDEGGGKRRESEDKSGKKPGRKPLTSEPTTKRKAQNRAAQRAFRERKEKHLKDLEVKVDDLEKASESANHENGLLRAQVERLQVELKEYRKRLSWVSTNATGRTSLAGPTASLTKKSSGNDFQFEFPKFGDLPANHIFNNGSSSKSQGVNPSRSSTLPAASSWASKTGNQVVGGILQRNSFSSSSPTTQAPTSGSTGNSPINSGLIASPQAQSFPLNVNNSSIDSLSGLFSPSIIEAGRNASFDYFPSTNMNGAANQSYRNGADQYNSNSMSSIYNNSSVSNTDSPSSSSDSHHPSSSMGTSPEPSLSSPGNKLNDFGLNTISEENQIAGTFGGEASFCEKLGLACGNSTNPIPPIMSKSNGGHNLSGSAITPSYDPSGFNWLAQQNGGGFDPVLFGEYRESQNAVVSQDFGTFFNDAFPLPDLGSPQHNFNDVAPSPLSKPDPLTKADSAAQPGEEKEEQEEVVPGDKGTLMTCNKIWDRLQSMEKFRNGEIDVDNLCAELRSKARCSEGGAVVDEKEVDRILGKAK